jgi:hypothetical protein
MLKRQQNQQDKYEMNEKNENLRQPAEGRLEDSG